MCQKHDASEPARFAGFQLLTNKRRQNFAHWQGFGKQELAGCAPDEARPVNQKEKSAPHFNAATGHHVFRLGNTVLPKVKDAGGQYGIGMAFENTIGQVV